MSERSNRRSPSEQLAHDLRAPLSAILVWEEVARGTEDPQQLDHALDAIRASAREQLALLDRYARDARRRTRRRA